LGQQGLSKTGIACPEKDKLLKAGSKLPFRRLTQATAAQVKPRQMDLQTVIFGAA